MDSTNPLNATDRSIASDARPERFASFSSRKQNCQAPSFVEARSGPFYLGDGGLDTAVGILARKPELDNALLPANRAGDQVVVTKGDRLDWSLKNPIELANTLQGSRVDLVVLDQAIAMIVPTAANTTPVVAPQ